MQKQRELPVSQSESMAWGWVSSKGPQSATFPSPDAAIKAMQAQQGDDTTVERMAAAGVYLALVRVKLEVVMVLSPPDPPYTRKVRQL